MGIITGSLQWARFPLGFSPQQVLLLARSGSSANTGAQRSIHYAARSKEGKDVVIRLVAKGEDGLEELEILRTVASPPLSTLPANHALPMLMELSKDDMRFAVFPMVSNNGVTNPWFSKLSEALELIDQVLEVRRLPWTRRVKGSR